MSPIKPMRESGGIEVLSGLSGFSMSHGPMMAYGHMGLGWASSNRVLEIGSGPFSHHWEGDGSGNM
eukprot:635565-Pyramimonas_sp.AAC.1